MVDPQESLGWEATQKLFREADIVAILVAWIVNVYFLLNQQGNGNLTVRRCISIEHKAFFINSPKLKSKAKVSASMFTSYASTLFSTAVQGPFSSPTIPSPGFVFPCDSQPKNDGQKPWNLPEFSQRLQTTYNRITQLIYIYITWYICCFCHQATCFRIV